MKAKILKFDAEARKKLLEGSAALAKAVASTMGPRGRVVINMLPNGKPVATKDGISVANEIKFSDEFKNVGAQLVKQAAEQTAETAGDGTTSATVIANALFHRANEAIEAGANPVLLKKGMELATKHIVQSLKSRSKPCKTAKEIAQVATISANDDKVIGALISKAMKRVGINGTITVEESPSLHDELEIVDGVRFDQGAVSPYFLVSGTRGAVKLDNPYVLITNKKISTIRDMVGLLEDVAKRGRSLLIIAEDVEREALQALVLNNAKGILNVIAVRPPELGEFKVAALDDLALLTGTRVMVDEMGEELESLTLDQLGSMDKAIITEKTTTLVRGHGDADKIKAKIKELKENRVGQKEQIFKDKIDIRIARLTGGVAVLKLGAATELELREKVDRVDDALRATIAAAEEGIVAGGGNALMESSLRTKLSAEDMEELREDSKLTGYQAAIDACRAPYVQILKNSGIIAEEEEYAAIDARSGKQVDLIKEGIIDPTKVVRVCLQNAVSVVGLMITTSCVIIEEDLEKGEEKCKN